MPSYNKSSFMNFHIKIHHISFKVSIFEFFIDYNYGILSSCMSRSRILNGEISDSVLANEIIGRSAT